MKPDWNAIAKVGIPGVIAVFLVWRLAEGFDVFDLRLRAVEQQHADMIQHSARVEDLMGRSYMANERVLFVLRAMCVNDAKSADARRLCFEAGQ